jgi:hypothetical protein
MSELNNVLSGSSTLLISPKYFNIEKI